MSCYIFCALPLLDDTVTNIYARNSGTNMEGLLVYSPLPGHHPFAAFNGLWVAVWVTICEDPPSIDIHPKKVPRPTSTCLKPTPPIPSIQGQRN